MYVELFSKEKMLSDIKTSPSGKRRPVNAKTNLAWSDSQKIEAVQTYLLLGSVKQTSFALKIPEPTLIQWRTKDWWKDLEKEVKAEESITLSNKLKTLVDKSLNLVGDRLDKGDFIYDQKTGKLKRKPVALRDIHRVAVDMVAVRDRINHHETQTIAQDSIADKLAKLAAEFAKVADKLETKPTVNVTDVIYIENEGDTEVPDEERNEDAVYEEREEGL